MQRFLAHFLFILAAWTVVIKYLFPMAYAFWRGEPIGSYVYWDFWPLVHVWLGWSLLNWSRYTYASALVVSVAEIIIVVTKLGFFLSAPEWTIWRTNWFINKLFVLACFVLLLAYLVARTRRPRRRFARLLRQG
ncbi:MAG TPA: hypothetical protein VFB54_11070 [Burkholderiales bacterium]|nr:hypothetical protein [Burkholderiales bacterium]